MSEPNADTKTNANADIAVACPNCDKSAVEGFRPFCSKRCADLDLGAWFNGNYSIPAVEPPDDWSDQSVTTAQHANDEDDPWLH